MLKLIAAALIVATAGGAGAQQALSVPSGTYQLDRSHASVIWRVSHMGISMYPARFTKFAATLELDAADASRSRLSATIDPASVRTDYPDPAKVDFDKEIASTFLEAGKYPEIRYVSTAIRWTSATTGQVTGNLTFHGVTRPVTLDVKLVGANAKLPMMGVPGLGVQATGRFKRSDFGVSKYIPVVGDEVELTIDAEFHGIKK